MRRMFGIALLIFAVIASVCADEPEGAYGGRKSVRIFVDPTVAPVGGEVTIYAMVSDGASGVQISLSESSGQAQIQDTTLITDNYGCATTVATLPVLGHYCFFGSAQGYVRGSAQSDTIDSPFTGKIEPHDNFTGHSDKKLGVGETGRLKIVLPKGKTLDDMAKPLIWSVKEGSGLTVGQSDEDKNKGEADFVAGDDAADVVLSLKDNNGAEFTLAIKIVKPSGAIIEQEPGTNVWHVQGQASVGFKGRAYIQPADVSFENIEVKEGAVAGVGNGYFQGDNGQVHPEGQWLPIGPVTPGKGSKDTSVDTIQTGPHVRLPYAKGTFLWAIPWLYRVGAGAAKQFTIVNHEEEIDATGKMTIRKGGTTKTKALNDPSSGY